MHWLTQSGVGAAPGRGGVDSASPSPSTAGKSLNIINISRPEIGFIISVRSETIYQILIRYYHTTTHSITYIFLQ